MGEVCYSDNSSGTEMRRATGLISGELASRCVMRVLAGLSMPKSWEDSVGSVMRSIGCNYVMAMGVVAQRFVPAG